MSNGIRALAVAVAVIAPAVGFAPTALADDDNPDVYGFITPVEQQEISANGNENCVALDHVSEDRPPVTSESVRGLVEGYRAKGWDLESAGDIVWESVEGRCPGYLDQVKQAMSSYGPMH
jgi:hypothetical protein